MYDAVTGTARPRIQTATAERITVPGERSRRQSNDQAGRLQTESRQRDDADDDAGDGGGGEHGQHVLAARRERLDRARRRQPRLPRHQETHADGRDDGPEDRAERREADHHQDGDENERNEVQDNQDALIVRPAVTCWSSSMTSAPCRIPDPPRPHPCRIPFDHQSDRQVVQDGRHRRHDEHLQIRDAQVLGDEECRGAERRWRQECADAGCGEHARRPLRLRSRRGA